MRAIIDGDLVIGFGLTVEGPEIPPDMIDVSIHRLRWDNDHLIDIKDHKTFYVDPMGNKHIAAGKDRQKFNCGWDEQIIKDGEWRLTTPSDIIYEEIKSECEKRIRKVMGAVEGQVTLVMLALVDKELAKKLAAIAVWIEQMRATSLELTEKVDHDYKQDGKWPAAPKGFDEMARRR